MSKFPKFKVNFDSPQHGWIKVFISYGEKEVSFSASHIPAFTHQQDSISELVNALIRLLDHPSQTDVYWLLEPAYLRFSFEVQENRVEFKIFEAQNELFSHEGSIYEIVRSFWAALRELETRQPIEVYEKSWLAAFPTASMKMLTERVRLLEE